MIAFHTCYDLAYLYGWNMPWFTMGAFQEIWRCSISWTFLFIAGWMTSLSRNNLKRGALYATVALVVFIATTVAAVDTPINFGIIFCMAASTLLYWALEKPLSRINPKALLTIALVIFLATRGIPKTTYDIQGLSWLGFPSPTFVSGDYYPLIPFFFMYLAGATAARWHKNAGDNYPEWMYQSHIAPLGAIGTKSLPIYLIHQPLVLLVLMVALG